MLAPNFYTPTLAVVMDRTKPQNCCLKFYALGKRVVSLQKMQEQLLLLHTLHSRADFLLKKEGDYLAEDDEEVELGHLCLKEAQHRLTDIQDRLLNKSHKLCIYVAAPCLSLAAAVAAAAPPTP